MTAAIKRGRDEFIAFKKALGENQGQTQIEEETWIEVLALANNELHFSPLSDAEWAVVRASIEAGGRTRFDELSIRRAVDDAAVSSGYFSDFGVYDGPDRRTLTDSISEHKKIIKKIDDIILHIDATGVPARHKSNLNALRGYIVKELEYFTSITLDQTPNAKIPLSIDRWGFYIIRVWKDLLGLPVTSGVRLQRFIVACASPYGRYVTQAQARRFLERYVKGDVINAGAPIIEVLRDQA